jgi:hypothetical protein
MKQDNAARRLWTVFEPYHEVVYFAPEVRTEYADAGLKGYWMGYFASRGAAFGPVAASVITATFYTFAPRMVERAIPDAWRYSTPEQALAARRRVADSALRRLIGDVAGSPEVGRAADLAREAIEGCDVVGRPLFAAHLSLPWPAAPHLALWHAATLLREHRGDGHSASLFQHSLDGCEALLTFTSPGTDWRKVLQPIRGWTDDEWDAARERLTRRGWLDESGALSAEGQAMRDEIERETDRLARPPFERLGADRTEELYALLLPLARTIIAKEGVPIPNPVGVPVPEP